MPKRIIKVSLAVFRKLWLLLVFIMLAAAQIWFLTLVEKRQAANLTVAVLNNDRGGGGAELVRRLENTGFFTSVAQFKSYSQVKSILEQGSAVVILVVPEELTNNILSGKTTRVQLILDGRRTSGAMMAKGRVLWELQTFSLQAGGLNKREDLVMPVLRYWYEEELTLKWYAAPGITCILALLTALVYGCLFVPRDVRPGAMRMLLGGVLPAFVMAALGCGVMLLAVMGAFQIPRQDNMLSLYWVMTAFVLAVIAIVFAVCGLLKRRLGMLAGVPLMVVALLLLSGMFTAVEEMPRWLQSIAAANPLCRLHAVTKAAFINDAGVETIIAAIRPVLITAAIALSAAAWLFRRRKAESAQPAAEEAAYQQPQDND